MSFSVFAQTPKCDPEDCKSQLLRVDIAKNVLNEQSAANLLPSLQSLSQSPALVSAIQNKFPLEPFGFPHTLETCLREKAEGDPDFKNITCEEKDLCSNPSHPQSLREKVCFKLPCGILEGDQQVGKCGNTLNIFPTEIGFPTPIDITKFNFSPTKVEYKNNKANLCFNISELEINMSTRLAFDTKGTELKDKAIEIRNINPKLDAPRELCVSVDINLGTANPISNLKLNLQGNRPLISEDIIRNAAKDLEISGLSGYKPEDLKAIQSEVVPALFYPIRESIEKGITTSLEKVFNDKIQSTLAPILTSQSTMVDSSSFMSELGISNMQVKNQLAKVECAQLKAAGRQIPSNHACIGLPHFPEPTVTPDTDFTPSFERSKLISLMRGGNVTSENVKQRLTALRELILVEKMPSIFTDGRTPEEIAETWEWYKETLERDVKEDIDPLIASIEKAQLESKMYDVIGIQNQLNPGMSNSLGIIIPDICTEKPSPHAGKKMQGCPISVYADLVEFNQVLKKMWESGRLCMHGAGEFRPKLDAAGKPAYDPEGKPLANSGCRMDIEGMSCYVKNPPQLKYDNKTKKYKVDLALKSCFRGPVIFGLGKFGGDFNIDFSFKPTACSNGDFCMDKPEANWSIVPGSERFSLQESSFFDKIIKDKINDAVQNAVKDTIRIPMAGGVGPLGNIPLQAEGRVDTGPGYFGVCLEPAKAGSGQ